MVADDWKMCSVYKLQVIHIDTDTDTEFNEHTPAKELNVWI